MGSMEEGLSLHPGSMEEPSLHLGSMEKQSLHLGSMEEGPSLHVGPMDEGPSSTVVGGRISPCSPTIFHFLFLSASPLSQFYVALPWEL